MLNYQRVPPQEKYFTGENDEKQSELEVPTARSSLPIEIPIMGRRYSNCRWTSGIPSGELT